MKCIWPTRKFCVGDPTQPIFYWLALGFCVGGNTNIMFCILAFLDTNMLVSPTQTFGLGEPPMQKFALAPTPVVLRRSGIYRLLTSVSTYQ